MTFEELVKALLDQFDVTEETARNDLTALLAQFRELELIEDENNGAVNHV